MVCAGSPAGPASFCPYAFSRGCFVVSSSKNSWSRSTPASCSSLESTPISSARDAFMAFLAPLRETEWVVYCKQPFGGPEAVLAYLARYTHRVAISNSRLIALRRRRRHVQMERLPYQRARSPKDDDAPRPPSSSAAFSFTSCRAASIAFAITACSPAALARKTSPRRAGYSRRPGGPVKTPPPMTPATTPRPPLRVLARAAAVA